MSNNRTDFNVTGGMSDSFYDLVFNFRMERFIGVCRHESVRWGRGLAENWGLDAVHGFSLKLPPAIIHAMW